MKSMNTYIISIQNIVPKSVFQCSCAVTPDIMMTSTDTTLTLIHLQPQILDRVVG